MEYTYISGDDGIRFLLEQWRLSGVGQVAMDFECEFNLHCYGEHLCLIQIFDGRDFFLVDPLSGCGNHGESSGVTDAGLRLLLESKDIQKIWFDCASDGELVWKKYRIRIANVYDLRVVAKMVGQDGGLSALTSRLVAHDDAVNTAAQEAVSVSKKKYQQTNWMRRPLTHPQLVYALGDVALLFKLRAALDDEARRLNRLKDVTAAMKSVPHIKQNATPGHEKLPGYKRLSATQKLYARHFFAARDDVAKQFNLPPFRVLDKRVLVRLAQKAPQTEMQLGVELGGGKTEVSRRLLSRLVQATASAQKGEEP